MFVWSRNGANWTKAFVKGLLEPEFNIVGGVVCFSNNYLYNLLELAVMTNLHNQYSIDL